MIPSLPISHNRECWLFAPFFCGLIAIISYALPKLLRRAIPDWRNGGTCQLCTRCWRSVCQRAHARSCGGHTRMVGRWNLPALHAMLAASLSVSACSLLRRAYPHGGTVELASSARDVGGRFVRERMLAPAEDIPAWWGGGTCQLCTRCWQPVCQSVHARSCGGHTRMVGRWNLPALHAMLAIDLLESACWHRLCAPHGLPLRAFPLP